MRLPACLWSLFLLICVLWIGVSLSLGGRTIDADATAVFSLESGDSLEARATAHLVDQNKILLRFAIGHSDPASLRDAERQLASGLRGLPAIDWIDAPSERTSRFQPLLQLYQDHAGMLLSPQDRMRLQEDEAQPLADRALNAYFGLTGRLNAEQIKQDPFLLTDAYLAWLADQSGGPQPRRKIEGRYFIALSAGLTGNATDHTTETELVSRLDELTDAVRRSYPGVEIARTGALYFSADQSHQAEAEVQTILAIASAGIILMTLVIFRSVLPLAGVLLVVCAGLATGTATAFALFDRIHLFAVVFGTSLIGVAVDYGYHYFAHAGEGTTRSFRAGLTLGMATSVLGFLCLGVSPMAVLGQIAVYSAAGLVGAYLTVLLLLTVLFPNASRQPPGHIAPLHRMAACHEQLLGKGSLLTPGALGLIALTAFGIYQFEPTDDLRQLGKVNPALATEAKLVSAVTGDDTGQSWLAIQGNSLQEVLEREERLCDILTATQPDATAVGLSNFLPSDTRQRLNATLVHNVLLPQYGSQLKQSAQIPIKEEADMPATVSFTEIERLLPPQVRGLVIDHPAPGFRHLLQLQGPVNEEILRRTVGNLDFVAVVDPAENLSRQLRDYRIAAYWALLLAVGLAAILALWRYGPRRGMRVFAVPGLATLIAFLLPAVMGGHQNFFTAMALFLVFAICADYALFLGETTVENRGKSYLAVTLSAISSGLAFGLLAFSSIPLVQDIGQVVLIGVISAWGLAPLAAAAGRSQ